MIHSFILLFNDSFIHVVILSYIAWNEFHSQYDIESEGPLLSREMHDNDELHNSHICKKGDLPEMGN